MDARLEAQERDAAGTGLPGEMVEDAAAEPGPAICRADVHPFDLRVFAIHEQDAAAARGRPVRSENEELDALGQQPVDAEAVPARGRIQRLQVRLQFEDQPDLRSVGRFLADDDEDDSVIGRILAFRPDMVLTGNSSNVEDRTP